METAQSQTRTMVLIVIGVLLLGIFIYLLARGSSSVVVMPPPEVNTIVPPEHPISNPPVVPQVQITRGVFACLPHKNTGGPVTMECAFGLHADDGFYYGIDTTLLPPGTLGQFQTGDRIEVTGNSMPVNDALAKYDIKAVLQATSARKL